MINDYEVSSIRISIDPSAILVTDLMRRDGVAVQCSGLHDRLASVPKPNRKDVHIQAGVFIGDPKNWRSIPGHLS